jgi:hypothetical protein
MPISIDFYNTIWHAYQRCFQIIVSPHYHKDLGDPKGFGSQGNRIKFWPRVASQRGTLD